MGLIVGEASSPPTLDPLIVVLAPRPAATRGL